MDYERLALRAFMTLFPYTRDTIEETLKKLEGYTEGPIIERRAQLRNALKTCQAYCEENE